MRSRRIDEYDSAVVVFGRVTALLPDHLTLPYCLVI